MDNNFAADVVPIILLSLLSIAQSVAIFVLWKRAHDANSAIGFLSRRVSPLEQHSSFSRSTIGFLSRRVSDLEHGISSFPPDASVSGPNIDFNVSVSPSSVLNTSELVGIRVQSDVSAIPAAALNPMVSFGNTDSISL